MPLHAASLKQFITEVRNKTLADKLRESFESSYGEKPGDGEYRSWQNSLSALAETLAGTSLKESVWVLLEYQLPLTSKRIDVMLCGLDGEGRPSAVIIELKQWQKVEASFCPHEVRVRLGAEDKDVLHPSEQAFAYQQYLMDAHTTFHGDQTILLKSCAFLHNYKLQLDDPLVDSKFSEILAHAPLFTSSENEKLCSFLEDVVGFGEGEQVADQVISGTYRPSNKLMSNAGSVLMGNKRYVLLDEQRQVYDRVFIAIEHALKKQSQLVLIIEGGPGTGKSVVALHAMAELMKKHIPTNYVTGSKAINETLYMTLGSASKTYIKYFNNYGRIGHNSIDVLLCDEAHRMRGDQQGDVASQFRQLLNACRVLVLFVDNDQTVRPNEVGSVSFFKQQASLNRVPFRHLQLEAQFRCGGADAFVSWLDNTLQIKLTANKFWSADEDFDFRIMDSIEGLHNLLEEKAISGQEARLLAGFCWKWNKNPRNPVNDVKIESFERPWNIGSAWAVNSQGINEVGCIYTAQGFEFDYVGVIFGNDLRYSPLQLRWEGIPENSYDAAFRHPIDKEQFAQYIKHTYKVLMTRAMKGCYVHFIDDDTRQHFQSRVKL